MNIERSSGPFVIVPNALDERLLVRSKINDGFNPFPSERVVIGYMGTKTHLGDLMVVHDAIREIADQNKEIVEFQILGVAEPRDLDDILEGIPYRIINPPSGEEEYPQFMLWFTTQVHWDIAIAPLEDNEFNQCKSDIKFLDYAAINSAGIYSDVAPYALIQQGTNGMKVGNSRSAWTEALETLLNNDEVRKNIAQNATEYLFSRRTLNQQAVNWERAVRNIID
jgi:glycosyltransferase involved in cell wall biosynthesis